MIGIAPDCLQCKHFRIELSGMICEAYPEGIPMDIVMGEKHLTLRDDQVGDFIFEKKKRVRKSK